MQRIDHVPESDRGDEARVDRVQGEFPETPDVAEPVVPDQSAYTERPLPGTAGKSDDTDTDDRPEPPVARTESSVDTTPADLSASDTDRENGFGPSVEADADREDSVGRAARSEAGESRHAETTHDAGDEGRRDMKIEAGDSAPHRATGEHVLDPELSTAYQERWRDLQATFVDDPAAAVHSAEELVMELTSELSNAVTRRREELSGSDSDERSDTEELRTTLRTYREIMQRLLEV